jgi:hypothetical protein
MNKKSIRIKKEVVFERLLTALDLEASRAKDHWGLLTSREESREEYWLEMNESNSFWHLTLIAHRDKVLAHLCRTRAPRHSALADSSSR